ncbi:response regulator transcription factor [Salsipaludibacter albus]|uniref:response regulator transcription factor n=1 Tax=Salsipaludibacter albus TaxID=2849650 RepID=UPI001EE3E5E5|nr:response regulator transcription factor [Salsipaludibacter albus]MBY5161298.1 response regulator transcription factor [Salsipaludibacter albus]
MGRIIVVDDTAVTRQGLAAILGQAGHDVRPVADHASLQPFLSPDHVDVVVCDLYLDGPDAPPSWETLAALAEAEVPTIVYSTWALDTDILASLGHGVRAFLQKGASTDPLEQAVAHVLETPDSDLPMLTPELAGALRRQEEFGLTEAEVDVLRHLSLHLTNAEVAEARFTSVDTVKTQVTSIRRKLGAATRGDAVRQAREHGLIGSWYVRG